MRQRFESSLDRATPKVRSWLAHALLACYSGLHGFRRSGPERAGFETWVRTLPEDMVAKPAEMEPTDEVKTRLRKTGCQVLRLRSHTGHVPVGHDLLLYRLAELSPTLGEALFLETPSFEGDRPPQGTADAYRLAAWESGQVFETWARFFGDNYDVQAVVGLLNSLNQALGYSGRFAELRNVVCAGSSAQLREAQNLMGDT